MNYLHTKTTIKLHGSLSSTRIYIDGKWSCKIWDFGLKSFRHGEVTSSAGTSAYYRGYDLLGCSMFCTVTLYLHMYVYNSALSNTVNIFSLIYSPNSAY